MHIHVAHSIDNVNRVTLNDNERSILLSGGINDQLLGVHIDKFAKLLYTHCGCKMASTLYMNATKHLQQKYIKEIHRTKKTH